MAEQSKYPPLITRNGPAIGGETISPSDSTDLPFAPARGIWVGVTGNVQLTPYYDADGTSVIIMNAQQGTIIPIVTKRVWNASTTATSLVALY